MTGPVSVKNEEAEQRRGKRELNALDCQIRCTKFPKYGRITKKAT
jgi:hypothetical protein